MAQAKATGPRPGHNRLVIDEIVIISALVWHVGEAAARRRVVDAQAA
jgi:hypothetical protein